MMVDDSDVVENAAKAGFLVGAKADVVMHFALCRHHLPRGLNLDLAGAEPCPEVRKHFVLADTLGAFPVIPKRVD